LAVILRHCIFIWILVSSHCFSLVVPAQIIGYVSLCIVFWSTPLFVAPDTDYLLRRLEYSLPSSSASLSDGALGIIPLLVALRALGAVLLGFVMPPPPAPPKARKFSFLD
jgi:hypothetical protein